MKKTKKIYSFILLFFFVGYAAAQNCTFSQDETDKFTNTRTLHTKPVNVIEKAIKQKGVYTIKKIELQVKYENNTSVLSLALHFDLGLFVSTNSKLILLLSNGTKIELPCLRTMFSQKIGGMPVQNYDFGLTEENFEELLKSDIEDARFEYSVNTVDFTISQKVSTSVFFNCINNNK